MKTMVLKHEVVQLSTNGGKTDYNCVTVDWLSPRCSPRPTLWTHTLTPLSLYIYIQLRYTYTQYLTIWHGAWQRLRWMTSV